MRILPLALVLAGCGGASNRSSSGSLHLTGSGTIAASSATVSASADESVPLVNDSLPGGASFTLAGGGRSAAADLDAVASALGNERLDALSGTELSVNQVLSGAGTLSYTGAAVQNLSFAYVVESYTPTGDAGGTFLMLQVSASSAGTSVFGSLSFAAPSTTP